MDYLQYLSQFGPLHPFPLDQFTWLVLRMVPKDVLAAWLKTQITGGSPVSGVAAYQNLNQGQWQSRFLNTPPGGQFQPNSGPATLQPNSSYGQGQDHFMDWKEGPQINNNNQVHCHQDVEPMDVNDVVEVKDNSQSVATWQATVWPSQSSPKGQATVWPSQSSPKGQATVWPSQSAVTTKNTVWPNQSAVTTKTTVWPSQSAATTKNTVWPNQSAVTTKTTVWPSQSAAATFWSSSLQNATMFCPTSQTAVSNNQSAAFAKRDGGDTRSSSSHQDYDPKRRRM